MWFCIDEAASKTVSSIERRHNSSVHIRFILKNSHGGSYPAALTLQKHVALSCQSHWHRPPDSENLGCLPQIQAVCNVGVNGTRCSIWLQAAEGYAAHECPGSHPGRKHTNGPELTRFVLFCFVLFIPTAPGLPPLTAPSFWIRRWKRRCSCCTPSPAAAWSAPHSPKVTPRSRTELRPRWGTSGLLPGDRCALTATVHLTARCTRRPVSAPVMLSGHSGVDTGRVLYPVSKGSRVRNVFYWYILRILTPFTSERKKKNNLIFLTFIHKILFFPSSKLPSVSSEFINVTHDFKVSLQILVLELLQFPFNKF